MPKSQKSSKRVSRSIRLRKYESAYRSCMEKLANRTKDKSLKKKESKIKSRKKVKESESKTKSRTKKKKNKKRKDDTPKTKLNDYQKFMRSESKKDKYSGMSGGDRMKAIGVEWKKKKERKANK